MELSTLSIKAWETFDDNEYPMQRNQVYLTMDFLYRENGFKLKRIGAKVLRCLPKEGISLPIKFHNRGCDNWL